jgi:hypothetical protein
MKRSRSVASILVVSLGLLAGASVTGCAAPVESDETADQQADLSEAKYSLRVVLPELTWSFDVDHVDPAGTLSIEVSAAQGGFLGIGADRVSTTSPLVMVGADAYGAGVPELRIGTDGTVYLQFDTTPGVELYCCTGSLNPERDGDGVWHGEDANIADVGKKGYYVVGKLVGVDPQELRHGTELRLSNLELADGMHFSFSRRIMRGDRQISIEATRAPELVTERPELAGDPDAAAEINSK